MNGNLKEKIVNIFVLIFSSILLLSSLFFFLNHIDYFSTRILTTTSTLYIKPGERDNKIGAFVKFSFIDSNRKEFITKEMFVDKDFYEEIEQKKQIKIYYTKYFNQVLLKGYKNPRILIFLLDLIMIGLFYMGIKAGLRSPTRKVADKAI